MDSSTALRVLPELKLPRKVEDDPRREAIRAVLSKGRQPLWEKSPYQVSEFAWTAALERVLSNALLSRKIELGIDKIKGVLEQQKRGLDALYAKQGTEPANRILRNLIASNDGSERLYRSCEALLTKNGDRLLMLRSNVPAAQMGAKIFGPDRDIKVILVTDREHVENLLFALVEAPSA